MTNLEKLFLYFLLFQSVISVKKIIKVEGNILDNLIQDSGQGRKKLFLIFYVKNCQYCMHSLRVLKNKIVEHFEEEDEITFGVVNLDSQANIWLGIRFNITHIPYIIMIENNKLYHYESQFEESLVLKFINEEKNEEDGADINPPVKFMQKFQIGMNELTEKINSLLIDYGIKFGWNMTMTYIFIFLILIIFVYLESKMINKLKYWMTAKKRNNVKLNEEIKDKNQKQKEENDDKEEEK